ncbi:glycosyltransferase [Halorubrum sp. ARQ200]|uniref:glycosyltransferase n=1 Tax=Halorubrum sp. ARQ200 TaxID=1855872 RepID=UPI0010F97E85|nr:glycosyltransferase [Halorubrum sp. ARQ200]TKX44651.1 colanic acid biosynthesis glycosyltransferase WcaL [Halorubrum sp. ARQ200]
MKIAFLTPAFPRYSETFIINQVASLLDLGHDVTVFSQGKVDSPAEHSILDDYDMEKRVNYIEGIHTYSAGIKQYLKSISGPQSVSDVLSAVKHRKDGPDRLAAQNALYDPSQFDICHAHFGPIARTWDFLPRKNPDTPFVATYYGYDVTKRLHPNNYSYYTRTNHWESVDLAIGISEHIRSKMLMAGCPEEITTTLPIGIDPDLFQFSPTEYDPNDELQLVSTCRHTDKKGIGYAIRAVSQLKKRGVDLSYTIAGDGYLTPEYREIASGVGILDEIEFVGRVSQERVSELMQMAHLYIQPSVTTPDGDMEGQGLVFQEAQATGTPPVTTFHNGIPEGVRHGETGRLAPERDISRLADELEYFVENPKEIGRYAYKGRKWVELEYDYTKISKRQEDLYKSLLRK